MSKIIRIVATTDYLVTVYFEDQDSVVVDMQGKLHTVRFSGLRNISQFISAKTDGRAILWPDGTSISISEILEIADR